MPEAFSCPTCGAPLTYDGGEETTIICPFCRNSVIVPEELHHKHPPQADQQADVNEDSEADEILLLQIIDLLVQNQKIEAIKLLRQNSSLGLKEAKDAVEEIESGQRTGISDLVVHRHPAPAGTAVSVEVAQVAGSRSRNLLPWLSVIVLLVIGVLVLRAISSPPPPAEIPPATYTVAPTAVAILPPTPIPTPQFASFASALGSEGIGAGKFSQPNSLTIDPDGFLYVGDYVGNRVQVFDPSGKFVVQWSLDPKLHLHNLVAGIQGEIYAEQSGRIFRYDSKTGQLTGEVVYTDSAGVIDGFESMAIALDGSLLAAWVNYDLETDTLLRFDTSGKLLQTIDSPILEQTGEYENDIYLAVNGLGNIYALGEHNYTVCVYTPQGKFINRFGSKGDRPGQFGYAENIAIDSRGRVYISEYRKVHVFDSDGLYLESFDIDGGGYEMVFDSQDNLYLLDSKRVMKYVLNR